MNKDKFGASDIPELRHEVLQGVIEKFMDPPELMLSGMFPEEDAESDTISWESEEGSRGMAPIVAPGDKSPQTARHGVAAHEAKAAMIKEMEYIDEETLNNLRNPGSLTARQTAETQIAKATNNLDNRARRRAEWMTAQMLFTGTMTYQTKEGRYMYVDYGIPSDQIVTLDDDRKWTTGEARDILEDVNTGINAIHDANGARVNYAFLNSTTLRLLGVDTTMRNILTASAFGNGFENLMKVDSAGTLAGVNAKALQSLLNIDNFIVYDEQYQARARLTSNLAIAGTTIYVDDPSDFVAGQTLRIYNGDTRDYEELTISSVAITSGTITVSTGPTVAYKARRDFVTMTSKFIPNYKFVLMADNVGGEPIAKTMRAPFGVNRRYGRQIDTKAQWDPEGLYIRIQDKRLPVLTQTDALYILTVG
jgi:hypothetical protein